ncbi:MAG: hypothetical protein ACT4PE_15445 [Candidatus Eiseniibacteriota bacterium]
MVARRNARVVRFALVAVIAAVSSLTAACSSSKVLIPPRVDLARYGTIGMIGFSSSPGELGEMASREFLAAIHSAQPGTPVLELGNEARVLGAVRADALDPQTIRSIGEKYGVDAIVVGVLGTQEVKPKVSLDPSVKWVSASAELEGALDARILETRSGATIWTAAARAREQVARVDVSGGGLSGLGASHPDEAKARLVRGLVDQATVDFWPHWERH